MTFDTMPPTVAHALAQTAARHAGAAYIEHGKSYSWPQVQTTVTVLARRLQALGIGRGDRIAIILPNCMAWIHTYLAAAQLGAVVVGLSVRYRGEELDFMLGDSQVKAVLAPPEFAGFDYVKYLNAGRARFPNLQLLLFLGEVGEGQGLDFQSLLQAGTGDEQTPLPHVVEPDDLLMIIYTSGTTGRPKAAGLTHRSQLASAGAQKAHTEAHAEDRVQLAMPLNHVGGISCGVLTLLLAGGCCELVPVFSADAVLEMTRRNPPTMLTGVPTMLTLLLINPGLAEANFNRLRLVIVGGSNVEPALLGYLQAAFPQASFMNLYGLSESSGAIVMTPWQADQQALLQSIGKPLTGAELMVAGADGVPLPAGQVGELWFRGAGVIPGYVGAQSDGGAFDAEGWLRTGDLGYLDAQGLIYLMGRQKDMFIQGGFNVYPAEVEAVIGSHPEVLMAAGIGVPDPVMGEVGRYYVVQKQGGTLTPERLQTFCRERLADYKVPRQIVFRDQLPLTPAGKIQKAVLRSELTPA